MLVVQYDDTQEVISQTRGVTTATRVARVLSRDLAVILRDPAASDLPVRGDSWSPDWPELVLENRTARPEGGRDAGPWSEIELTYEVGVGGGTLNPALRVPFTVIDHQTTSVTQLSTLTLGTGGAPDEIGPDSEPIADGRGTQRDAGFLQYTVHDPYDGWSALANRLTDIIAVANANAVNRDAITLPAYRQALGAGSITLQPGQARYHRFVPGEPDDLGRFWVQHVLLVAEDHVARWTNESPPGTSPVQRSGPIYPRADFSGLW